MIHYVNTKRKEDCCGCRACEQICNHHAILMKEDDEGFLYPDFDKDSCVNCGLCEIVCPLMQADKVLHPEGEPMAAQNLNKQDLATSSSGGVFIAIAKHVILNGGVVYGAAFEDGPTLCHQRVESVEGLEKLKGSKYLQSDIRNTFQMVKEDLQTEKEVYFVGTPCQVAGLRLFLRKDYNGLFTLDFVCHGTPSNKLFKNTITQIEKKLDATFKNYSFRDKKVRGWSCSSSSSWQKGEDKVCQIYSRDMEAYYNAFIQGDMMRMNCYECPFARHERCGDITLADHWGVRVFDPNFPNIGKGVSLILINTKKGETMFNRLKSMFFSEKISMAHTVRNGNLHRPSIKTSNRESSYRLAFDNYHRFVDKYYQGNYLLNTIRVYSEYLLRKSDVLLSLASYIKRMVK